MQSNLALFHRGSVLTLDKFHRLLGLIVVIRLKPLYMLTETSPVEELGFTNSEFGW